MKAVRTAVRRRVIRFVAVVAAFIVATSTLVLTSGPRAEAADPSSFDPGWIISDQAFFDDAALNEAEVQAALNRLGRACASGYTCLRDYRQTTTARAADAMCSAYQGASNESAARIIFKVGQACGVSQKALIVLLEKEQSLVTTSAPSATRYERATGYACPDTAPCDAQFFGFFNQVYKAAWQFKRYLNPPGTSNYFTWYPVGQVVNVAFNPNADCGAAPVRIRNQATAALYYYTPYQPNAAALGNLYGVGDGCSSYGNRNFWRLYSDWFGSTVDSPYMNVDSITGVWGGVSVSGWSRSPSNDTAQYVWVNVDGQGAATLADKPLPWFPGVFPGYGQNHGFSTVLPAAPGQRDVCVYDAASGNLSRCTTAQVPRGVGSLDSVTPVRGGVQITGWSADALAQDTSFIWVNVDGQGGPFATNKTLQWLPALLPGASPRQGFDIFIASPPGKREICVYGAEAQLGCRTVEVPQGTGYLDSAEGAPGRIDVSGWYVDYSRTDRSMVWLNVDGRGGPYATNVALPWLAGYLPGAGTGHGFAYSIPASKGSHRVCAYGAVSGQAIGCKTVTVPYSAAGNLDSAQGVSDGIRLTGWSVDLLSAAPSYIWINVDGVGGPARTGVNLSWFGGVYPGVGNNHGFDVTVPASKGTREVCVYGAESQPIGCTTVVVP